MGVDFAFMASMVGKVISRKLSAVLGNPSWDFLAEDASKNIDDVASLIRDLELKQIYDEESPFEFGDWRRMFDKAQANASRGKLVMKVADDRPLGMAQTEQLQPVVEDDGKENEEPVDTAPDEDVKVEEEEVVAADANEAQDVAANDGAEEAADVVSEDTKEEQEEAVKKMEDEEAATEDKEEPAAADKEEPATEDKEEAAAADKEEPAAEDKEEPAAADKEEP